MWELSSKSDFPDISHGENGSSCISYTQKCLEMIISKSLLFCLNGTIIFENVHGAKKKNKVLLKLTLTQLKSEIDQMLMMASAEAVATT